MKVEWGKQIAKVGNDEGHPWKKKGKDQKPQRKVFHFKGSQSRKFIARQHTLICQCRDRPVTFGLGKFNGDMK